MANPDSTDRILESVELLLSSEKWTTQLQLIFGEKIDFEQGSELYAEYVLRGNEIQDIVERYFKLKPGEHSLTRILNHHIKLLLEAEFSFLGPEGPGRMFNLYSVRQNYLIEAVIERVLSSNHPNCSTAFLTINELFPMNTLRQLEDEEAFSAFKDKTISESRLLEVFSRWVSCIGRQSLFIVSPEKKNESKFSPEDLIDCIRRTLSGFSETQLKECGALLVGKQHCCLEGLSLLLLSDNQDLVQACCDVRYTAPWHHRLLRLTTGLSQFCSKIKYRPDYTQHPNLVKFFAYHILTFPHPIFRKPEAFDLGQSDNFLHSFGIRTVTLKEWRDWQISSQAKNHLLSVLSLCSSDPQECRKIITALDAIGLPFDSKQFKLCVLYALEQIEKEASSLLDYFSCIFREYANSELGTKFKKALSFLPITKGTPSSGPDDPIPDYTRSVILTLLAEKGFHFTRSDEKAQKVTLSPALKINIPYKQLIAYTNWAFGAFYVMAFRKALDAAEKVPYQDTIVSTMKGVESLLHAIHGFLYNLSKAYIRNNQRIDRILTQGDIDIALGQTAIFVHSCLPPYTILQLSHQKEVLSTVKGYIVERFKADTEIPEPALSKTPDLLPQFSTLQHNGTERKSEPVMSTEVTLSTETMPKTR